MSAPLNRETKTHGCRSMLRGPNPKRDGTNNYPLQTSMLCLHQLSELYFHHRLNNRQSYQMSSLCEGVDPQLGLPAILPNQVHLHYEGLQVTHLLRWIPSLGPWTEYRPDFQAWINFLCFMMAGSSTSIKAHRPNLLTPTTSANA